MNSQGSETVILKVADIHTYDDDCYILKGISLETDHGQAQSTIPGGEKKA
jgi:hypothetical protein